MTTDATTFEKVHIYSNPSYDCVCSGCGEQFSLHVREPRISEATPSTCTLCAASLTACNETYINMDVFDYIALDFNLGREAVLGIYELWNPSGGDDVRFVDFLKRAIVGDVV